MRLSVFLLGINLLLWDPSPRDESSICLSNMTTVIHQICTCEGKLIQLLYFHIYNYMHISIHKLEEKMNVRTYYHLL